MRSARRYKVTNQSGDVQRAEKIILPGVGHFGQMMRAIDDLGLRQSLLERMAAGVPFLGICVGLQCLFERSEESPGTEGLGIFRRRNQTLCGQRAHSAHGLELIRTREAVAITAGPRTTAYLLTLRTATTRRRWMPPPQPALIFFRTRQCLSMKMYMRCSFILRNPGLPDCR